MGNAKKTTIHIPKLNGWSVFVFILYPLLFQNLTDLWWILEIKKNFAFAKNRNAKNFKTKFQQRGVKLKCSIDKWAMLLNSLPLSPTKSDFGIYFYLFAITFQNKIVLINLFLIT